MAFEKYTADADLAEFFKGLPDDQCQAAHWGYVVTGKVTFKTPSGEETFETGDAFPRVTPQCCMPAPVSVWTLVNWLAPTPNCEPEPHAPRRITVRS